MKTKLDWTQDLYQLYRSDNNDQPPQEINILLWYNLNKDRGFRLTTMGFELLRNTNTRLYLHKLNVTKYPVTSRTLVTMDRVLKLPWFWNNKADLYTTDGEFSSILSICEENLLQAVEFFS
jgi:hypothetical protein